MNSASQKRRLATILAADVVSYSKLMARDEEATVRTLKSYREVTDKFIARHDGRIFNTAGDSVLAEFGSAVEAVRCAISIQDELRVRNAELVAERQMQFRIGINVGDVLVDGDDLLGDGVNVAARLEGIAAPGGVCISGSTFEQVKNKLSIGFEDLGPQQVKNIPEPVTAFGITSAPVSVQSEAGRSADLGASRQPPRGVGKWPIAAAGLAAILIAAGIGWWQFRAPAPASLASFPDTISTGDLRAAEIEAFMTGMRIEGLRAKDGQPFKIVFNADKTASYEFAGSGGLSGTTQRETGKWWVEDFRFCMQIRRFATGRTACPRITKSGQKVMAQRPDGTPLPWSLGK